MEDKDIERVWYTSLVSDNEQLDRLFEPQCALDVLAKKRADYIVDSTRLTRLFVHKRNYYESKNIEWDFNKTFSVDHYEFFIKFLSKKEKELCKKITYGDMYAKRVNAYAYPDEKWGDFVCVNVALYYFAYYMVLALIEPLKYDIPWHIVGNSIRIALRTWIGCEALDFEMDPRGIIPKEIEDDINGIVPFILVFISGHEFSHHLLGHCDKNNLRNMVLWSNGENVYSEKIYNVSQKDEFAADLGALTIPAYPDGIYEKIYGSALIWFIMLDLAEHASNQINPSLQYGYQTHPTALDRYNYILHNAPKTEHFSNELYEQILKLAEVIKEFISNDISENYGELYDEERYGSAYLDKPNTKWRGKELIDREDY